MISSIHEISHSEKEVKEVQSEHYLIEFMKCAKFKRISTYEGCRKATYICKPLPNFGDFSFGI